MFGFLTKKAEARADAAEKRASYTETLLAATLAAAEGGTRTAEALKTAPMEIAAGKWAGGFAMMDVAPASFAPYFRRDTLAWIGRSLARYGQAVAIIDPTRQRLWPAHAPLITGGPDPDGWRYEIERVGPGGASRQVYDASEVLHVQYAFDPARPWVGIAPLEFASTTAAMMGGIENALSQEAQANTGYLVPVPGEGGSTDTDADGNSTDPLAGLRQDIGALNGRTGLVESTSGGWGQGRGQAPQQDWVPRRIGANPPDTLLTLRDGALLSVLAAYGIPPSLVGAGGAAQANREAWRQFLHGTLQPLGQLVADEAGRKFGEPLRVSFDQLFASDLQGRARAFQSMVQSGMPVERAAMLAGLLTAED